MPSKYLNDARTGELIQKIYTADRAVATECKSYTDTNYLPLAGGTLTGAVNGVTATASDDSKQLATTGYVKDNVPVSVGSGTTPVYTDSDGKVTASSSTVGDTDTPVYMDGGTITSIGATLFNKIVTHLASATAASISSVNTSSLFYRFLGWALTASGMRYNFSNANAWYICLGSLFGGLIIQGGTKTISLTATNQYGSMYETSLLESSSRLTFPITYESYVTFNAFLRHSATASLCVSKAWSRLNYCQVNYIMSPVKITTAASIDVNYIAIGK